MRRQVNSVEPNGFSMAEEHFLNHAAIAKQGSDTIFSWWAKYQNAKNAGVDAVNATIGALLEDDGQLAINKVVDNAVRVAPESEISSYAPLPGLPQFLDLSKTLALGDARGYLEKAGFHISSTATPGGSGALYLAANNFLERGQTTMLRDRHWEPYKGFLTNNGLECKTWPLLPAHVSDSHPYFARIEFEETLAGLCSKQSKVMVWLNDPAHNPTGLSMTSNGRSTLLDSFVSSALMNESVGHTLLIDLAYSLYAEEPHGWADTILDAIKSGMMWPENLLITFAVSLSKSHTIYGLRTGALVSLHPEKEIIDRLETVMSVTGRQTWSAAPRIAQYCVSKIHSSADEGLAWEDEKNRLKQLLVNRRNALKVACENLQVPLNPTMDGFFAWIEADNPVEIAESCASEHVYVVPLKGGIRIGLCALPLNQVAKVAQALSNAFR
ncbi:MAG: aminotransferase class I/II-fold pyridoxal phosphate-dependent enzyme [Candidatus Poseidoniaceae archaeon]|jgi:aromatic-amino-acid transaminase|nr:aminotransferase class I/II-fold pyridoxal phosphate-dependent enzyme [Candidatus Poseidoniaceae archaeon]